MSSSVLIPAYKPDEKLVNYVESLIRFGFDDIIVINDGSPEEYDKVYQQIESHPECTVLRHEVNRGKGAGLKTGFKFITENRPECRAIVTGDADGQHTLEDTAAVLKKTENNPGALVLGVRDFSLEQVPAKSRFGNRLTSFIFKLLYGCSVSDTQTGLRGIPISLAPLFIATEGSRYEYEMNMLIMCADRNIPIVEQPIQTVYIDDNSSSHFRPIADSLRIYYHIFSGLFKYMLSGVISYIIDIVLFSLLSSLILPALLPNLASSEGLLASLGIITMSTAIARVISSICNFATNKIFVFKKSGDSAKSGIRFILLTVFGMLVSSGGIWFIHNFLLPMVDETYIKLFVDFLLMLFNYYIQRIWVFKKQENEY